MSAQGKAVSFRKGQQLTIHEYLHKHEHITCLLFGMYRTERYSLKQLFVIMFDIISLDAEDARADR